MSSHAEVGVTAGGPLDPADPARVLLWDADGVLQHPSGDAAATWLTRLDAWGGKGFAEAVFAAEKPALRGEARFRDVLDELLATWPGATADVDDLLGLWEEVERDDAAIALVEEVAASGVSCVLATNQQDYRRDFLRENFGYDDVFARSFYSCDLGAMKPEPEYFARVLAALDVAAVDAATIGFVDDSAANVETARRLGIRAVHHDPSTGVDGLRQVLGMPS